MILRREMPLFPPNLTAFGIEVGRHLRPRLPTRLRTEDLQSFRPSTMHVNSCQSK